MVRWPRVLAATLGLVLLDQLTKIAFTQKVVLLPFLHLTPVRNTGTIFGLFPGHPGLFALVAIFPLGVLAYYVWKEKALSDLEESAYILVFAGLLGNMVDRVALGYVRDFLDMIVWPVFNLADAFTVLGVLLLMVGPFVQRSAGSHHHPQGQRAGP